ncbi:MAG: RtcB family protein [Vulcanimicrobiota bacterium]
MARHYHRLARQQSPRLPPELREWAWLSQDSADYEPFWRAAAVCLAYSEASHRWLHQRITQSLGLSAIFGLSCPHNFASLEDYQGERVVVHRKGAIRLGPGELGLIAGSMTAPTYLVRGRDDPQLLFSAAHGAGRLLSRATAHRAYRGRAVAASLGRVRVLQSASDEWPAVYRDIESVVTAHGPVLDRLGRFWPRMVRMCGPGFVAED